MKIIFVLFFDRKMQLLFTGTWFLVIRLECSKYNNASYNMCKNSAPCKYILLLIFHHTFSPINPFQCNGIYCYMKRVQVFVLHKCFINVPLFYQLMTIQYFCLNCGSFCFFFCLLLIH